MEYLSLELFKNPPSEYRGVPFFSINDILEPSKLVEFAKQVKDAGFGGLFFHAREGLITPFLSNKWFEAFEKLAETSKDLNLNLWIYDEDRWPSGFASGLLASRGPRFRAKALVLIIDNKGYFGEELLATFKCKLNEKGLPVECVRIDRAEMSSDHIYLSFFKYTASIGDPWFQGFSYVDLLSPQVVEEYIRTVYEPYAERFRRYFGTVIKGVFTDEPNIHDSRPRFPHWWKRIPIPPRGMNYPVYAIPWSDGFEDYFKKLNNYNIVDKLPELFFDIGDYVKTRYDYWRTITILFVESFTKKIYDWCNKHGLKLTGHFLAEDNLLDQISVGSVMPHYEYMHIPAIDHLGYQIWNSLLTAKQVSSVAEQLGKERVLCETYGELGYFASFEDRKWIGDFLFALGVNMINHHLIPYSLRGRRKADYGLFFHPSQPWWKYNRILEDYFARLSYILSRGKRLTEVLVIHPMGSVWSTYSPVNDGITRLINEKYFEVLRALVRNHIDFELGDELLIEKHGIAENRALRIGRSRYRIVVLPPMINISSKVLQVLAEFAKDGGIILAVEHLPKYVDGVGSGMPGDLLERVFVAKSVEELVEKMNEYKKDLTIVVESPRITEDILYHARLLEDTVVVFVTNVSRTDTHTARIGVKGVFEVELWDPLTGNVESASAKVVDGRTWVETTLKPVRSRIFIFKPAKLVNECKTIEVAKTGVYSSFKVVDLRGEWRVKPLDKNNLVLDYARVWLLERQSWTQPMPLPKIKDEFLSTGIGRTFQLKFEFYIEELSRDLELVIEYSKSIKKLLINNFELNLESPTSTWLDWNFRSYKIPVEILKQGLNEVVIEITPSLEPELEPIYIRGYFSVDLRENGRKPVIVKPVETIHVSEELDLTKNGYPFYAGEIILSKEFDINEDFVKAVVVINGLNAALALIEVNNTMVSYIIHRDDEVDVSKFLRKGRNSIRIILVGTLRNLLGPLHREHPREIYPELFYVTNEFWKEEYLLAPLGFKDVEIHVFEQ